MVDTTLIVRAPGRVNLIGEHTDYNGGFVLPMAIDRHTTVRASARQDDSICVNSEGFGPAVTFSLTGAASSSIANSGEWQGYVRGVICVLQQAGVAVRGADLQIRSTVPQGAGLSSSAALEVACAAALLGCAEHELDLTTLARLCQRAESEYTGARCGIMDQYVACHGQADHAMLLDCRSLQHRQIPLQFANSGAVFVACNSMVRHSVAGGEYNKRRAQCEAGARALAERAGNISGLRDVSSAVLAQLGGDMPELLQRRCRHVVSENERVLAAAEALEQGDAATFGALMRASHQSLRDDFEVSCGELDLLVDLAHGTAGVYGARMTGGGFGGCTINLMHSEVVSHFERSIAAAYQSATGKQPQIWVCRAGAGVTITHESGANV